MWLRDALSSKRVTKPYLEPIQTRTADQSKPYLETIETVLDLYSDKGMLPFLDHGAHKTNSLTIGTLPFSNRTRNRTRTATDYRMEFRSEDHFPRFHRRKKSRFASDFLCRGDRESWGLKNFRSRDFSGSGRNRRRNRRESRDFGALSFGECSRGCSGKSGSSARVLPSVLGKIAVAPGSAPEGLFRTSRCLLRRGEVP